MSRASRVGVTLTVLAALAALRLVVVPGLDPEAVAAARAQGFALSLVSLGALGIGPWIGASIVVELGALLRRDWRALRVGGPEARARIDRVVRVVWLALCAIQGYGLASVAEQLQFGSIQLVAAPGFASRLVITATLAGASALFLLGARIVRAHGLGDGVALLFALPLVEKALRGLDLTELFREDQYRASIVPVGLAVALATWGSARVLRSWDSPIPALASGLVPVSAAWGLVASLRSSGLPAGLLAEPATAAGALAITAVVAGIAWLYAGLFNLPWEVAAATGVGEDQALRALRAALPVSIGVCAVASLATNASRAGLFGPAWIDGVGLVTAVAIAVDLYEEWMSRKILDDPEVVREVQRPFEVPARVRALTAAGIPATVRGLRFRQVYQFFAPYSPIAILVPRRCAAEARAILGS